MNYIISKIFTAFFLPPGIFVIILIIASFLVKKFRIFFLVASVLFYLLSTKAFSNILISPLEHFSYNEKIKPNAVVVLGGGINPKDSLKGLPDMFKREIYGMILSKKHNLPLIITGGGKKYKESLEAQKDINLIEQICGCKIKFIAETKAKNTFQNAKFTSKLFNKLRLKKEIFLVTSAYHMKRAVILFKKFNFKIITKPVDFKSTPINSFLDFLPSQGGLNTSYKAIHEYIGILRAKLR